MAIELVPLPLPATADASKFVNFGREVKGVDPGKLDAAQFAEIREALYKVMISILNLSISYSLTEIIILARCAFVS